MEAFGAIRYCTLITEYGVHDTMDKMSVLAKKIQNVVEDS